MRYRRDVDGLRAVAVLSVLLFHAGLPGFPGGFVGVDVFFVISGFVITGGLIDAVDAGRFSISRVFTSAAFGKSCPRRWRFSWRPLLQ